MKKDQDVNLEQAMSIGFLILAAGLSQRFSQGHKLCYPLADHHHKPIILETMTRIQQVTDNYLIITSSFDSLVSQLLQQYQYDFTICPNANQGMGDTLAFGVKQTKNWSGWVIMLADMPLIQVQTLQSVWQTISIDSPLVVPKNSQGRGHPVGFGQKFYTKLIQLTGDQGAKSLLDLYQIDITYLACNDPYIQYDIDTLDDLS